MNKMIFGGVAAFLVLMFAMIFWPIASVPAGHRGVVVTFGSVAMQPLAEGLSIVSPFAHVYKVDVRLQKDEAKSEGASKDLQTVHTALTVNYRLNPDSVARLYKDVGLDFADKIIEPAVLDRFKAMTARYTAEELITKREDVRAGIREMVRSAVSERSDHAISVDDVFITNFAFSPSFSAAIEQKQVAEQNALKANRDLERIKIEAEQRIAQAQAEAKAIQIQAQSISAQGGPEYVRLKAVEKWDGTLPSYIGVGNALPFLSVGQK
jgi:regulator of protease activity HflC (stomatin/prohibitin superfamily)